MEQTTKPVDFYERTYSNFANDVLTAVRKETFGEDIGQNSWLTVTELKTFVGWLGLKPGQQILDVGSGSGGPSLYLANLVGCKVIGIDSNDSAVATANEAAKARSLSSQVQFRTADANQPLPFSSNSFDAVTCLDAINHLTDRSVMLREWFRRRQTRRACALHGSDCHHRADLER